MSMKQKQLPTKVLMRMKFLTYTWHTEAEKVISVSHI